MSTPGMITADEMADHVRRGVNWLFPDIADAVHDGAFEMTALATGQRFRVTVAEVDGWSDAMDAELSELTGTEQPS